MNEQPTINTMAAGGISLESLPFLSRIQLISLYMEFTGDYMDLSGDPDMVEVIRPMLEERLNQPAPEPVTTTPSGVRRKRFDLTPKNKIKTIRPGTGRARLASVLTQGATIRQVMDRFKWNYKTAHNRILALNEALGFGVREDEDGVITIFV